MRIPYPYTGVQASCRDPVTVKGDGVDLTEVALKGSQALPSGDAPYLGCSIVAPRHDQVTMDFEAADTGLMSHQNASASSRLQIPHSKRGVS